MPPTIAKITISGKIMWMKNENNSRAMKNPKMYFQMLFI